MLKQPKNIEYRIEYEPDMVRMVRALSNSRENAAEIKDMSALSLTDYTDSKLTVEQAAKIMRVTPQFLRIGLQQSRFPFGTAIRMKRWAYYINLARFSEYMMLGR